jgi:manganese efflux pump family protein
LPLINNQICPMSFIEIFLIALGLAADAFAVSVAAGSTGVTRGYRSMLRLSFHFGLFQFLMPIFGWLAGLSIARFVQSFDHWIAFGLLTWVAIRMIQSARSDEKDIMQQDPSRGMMLVVLSVATSLDALAIGLSLALLRVSIWYPSVVIGVVTGATSFVGILLGQRFSRKFGRRAAEIGGVLLILIGVRIILAHIFSL